MGPSEVRSRPIAGSVREDIPEPAWSHPIRRAAVAPESQLGREETGDGDDDRLGLIGPAVRVAFSFINGRHLE